MVYIKCHKCVYSHQVPHAPKRRSTHSVPGRQRQTPSTPVGPRTLAGWVGAGWLAGCWGEPRLPPSARPTAETHARSLHTHSCLPHPFTSTTHTPLLTTTHKMASIARNVLRRGYATASSVKVCLAHYPPLQGSPPPRPPAARLRKTETKGSEQTENSWSCSERDGHV